MGEKTEDFKAFGDQWVYCRQHLRPHKTGWCTVGVNDKVALGVETEEKAFSKCRDWGFTLYEDVRKKRGM